MSTAIEWTEETWNPTTGCDRISPGCDNCREVSGTFVWCKRCGEDLP